MYRFIIKDLRYRKEFFLMELRNLKYKYIINSSFISKSAKVFWSFFSFSIRFINKLKGVITFISSRCPLTGRSHWVLRRFTLSRWFLKELGNNGLISGLCKTGF